MACSRALRNAGILAASAAVLSAATACRDARSATSAGPPLFQLLDSARTGVSFVNALPETPAFNIVNYLYYYNGGGVAVGDVNGDGLVDLYFSSNLGSNRLYLNRGNYRFEDVTERAGVAGPPGWKTGVTMADVNGDGLLDIYVCAVNYLTMHGRNVLYVNNGDGTFTDRTKEFGLEFEGYATQALFFDYDGDGDLDLYLLNNSTHGERANAVTAAVTAASTAAVTAEPRNPRVSDRLYRNDNGHFVDVSASAGIHGGIDYGLGVVASDVNGDGCIDLYVANDFQENDYLYVNNCDGTFRDSITTATGHTSQFSMGVDAADVDNDLRPDVFVADMLPDSENVLKTSATIEPYELYSRRIEAGYHPQLSRNTLQLNRGAGRFSDVAPIAGVDATDWSWAPLLADFDNDGRKDIFVTSGIYRRPNDLDYIAYVGNPVIQEQLARGDSATMMTLLKRMPHTPLPNHLYRNDGQLRFTDMTAAWGLAQAGYSNGAAYADLSNSGRLDLVVSRINAPAAIYRNLGAGPAAAGGTASAAAGEASHYLRVILRGVKRNTGGVGARVIIRANGRHQMLENMPTRGFQSSVDPRLHFGLGSAATIDSLTVVWPDRRVQVLTNVAADRAITLVEDSARVPSALSASSASSALLKSSAFSAYKHAENAPVDFIREPLIPHVLSEEGPALAAGDVNGDGLDDIYVGGAKWQRGMLYLQRPDGGFRPAEEANTAFAPDSLAEDVDAVFFDANGDGRPDLYVVSGGNEFEGDDAPLQDRLYLSESSGTGRFRRDSTALPTLRESGSCVAVGDFNGDGHPDLFVGRRAVARHYGLTPRGYLLLNDGHGRFQDVTERIAPGLDSVGMVTSAAWFDYDGDGKLDLVVVGEWMPVRVFHQEGGRLVDRTASLGLAATSGWWNVVTVADLNRDGRPDLVLGNLGDNTRLRASRERPARLYVGDFARAGDGSTQAVLAQYVGDASYPVASRDELLQAIPPLRAKFPTYESFGSARIEDVLSSSDRKKGRVLEALTLSSYAAINDGGKRFKLHLLPPLAQIAPIFASVVRDFDGDGVTDILVAGNLYGMAPALGRADASYGLLLRGAGDGNFAPVDFRQSGVSVDGQVRHMVVARTRRGPVIVVARNNDRLLFLRPEH